MIAHSKPIALPHTNNSQLAYAEGSYTDDSFNPASFTRHFLGSPISWRASSFSNKFSASPTAHLLSSIDVSGKTPMDDSIVNAVNVFEREGELCRNYTCCNLQLNDLHALLEHFELVHIVVLDPNSNQPQAHIQIPFNPTIHDNKKPFVYDSDDMELDIDLGTQPHHPLPPSSRQSSVQSSPTLPDTPIETPQSHYPSPNAFIPNHLSNHIYHAHSPYISQPPSPLSTNYDPTTASSMRQNSPTSSTPNHLNLNLNLNLNLASHGFPRATPNTNLPNPEEAFNPYARFASDYSSSMPGALFNGATVDEASALHGATAWQVQQQQQQQQQTQQTQEGCVPPALLFSSSAHKHQGQNNSKNNLIKALSTSSLHRHHPQQQHHQNSSSTSSSSSQPASPSHTTNPHSLSRPGSLLLCKPFRCPKPNCNKSYKQANGLKYHMTHGSCNFAPPKDLEHVKDLLERKRREREGMSGEIENGSGLTRSASLGSAPATDQHHHSITSPSTPTTSSHSSPLSPTTPPLSASTSSAPSPPSARHSPPLQSQIKQNDRLSPSAILTYSDLSNISEHDLREVEREAERRLRPYACSVGDCQRRYKNMNGLRYHYQHSGDHGAAGLALLASGQHECLVAGRKGATSASGSMSVPVSRGGSISVGNSRTGTPQPLTFGVGVGSGVDIKPDLSVLPPATAPVGGGFRNTSPTQGQSQVQAQAQAYHQLQLQQFQQQQQQMRDQQQRQQQQQQQQNQQAQAQNQQHHSQHPLAAYHYGHMQRQYQTQVHNTQQQAQSQQQLHPISPLTPTFPPSVSSPMSPSFGGGITSSGVNGIKNPTLPMEFNLAMGLGMGMSVDMGLSSSTTTANGSGVDSGMGFNMGYDNGMGMGSDVNMGYGMHIGMGGDMGGLHHPLSSLGGQHHHHQQQHQLQIGNGMSMT